MLINCDIGERGAAHPVDDELMPLIDIANIACGGHAGDEHSIAHYRLLAQENRVKVTAHLSYPDREHFGRRVLDINTDTLLTSLDQQRLMMPDIQAVKLHGALYNEANRNTQLAEVLAAWFMDNSINEIVTQHHSELDRACRSRGLTVIEEAFIDRRYIIHDTQLALAPRSRDDAVITDSHEAIQQLKMLRSGLVKADGTTISLKAVTVCLHSDTHECLDILKAIRGV